MALPDEDEARLYFGRNGTVIVGQQSLLADTEDESVRREYSRTECDSCVSSVLQINAYAAVAILLKFYLPEVYADPFFAILMAVGFLCAVIPTVVAFTDQAVLRDRLPQNPNGAPRYHHISGWTATLSLVIVFTVVTLARIASDELNRQHQLGISGGWGLFVLGGTFAIFVGVIFWPRIENTTPARALSSFLQSLSKPLAGIGRIASVLDSWLVYVVAPLAGVTQRRTRVRYTLLFANLVPCCVAGWYLPAPVGLAPIAWAFLVIASVARRWAWVEDDRETAMLNANFDTEKLRVGFDEDLSDETLWSYISLFALVPIGMRQFHLWMPEHMFSMATGVEGNPVAWLAYFGTELAKAVPFVDWTEIYDVHGASQISAVAGYSRHVVFAARAIIDLVFLAALLQAISIAARTSKQKEMFRSPENPLDRLDPFVEAAELKKLVRRQGGQWRADEKAVRAFPTYNGDRLNRIRQQTKRGSALNVAARSLIQKQGEIATDPNERLSELVHAIPPAVAAVWSALNGVHSAGLYDLETLRDARSTLNGAAPFNDLRKQLVADMVAHIAPADERTTVLRHILSTNGERDSVAGVRRLTIEPLIAALVGGDLRAGDAIAKAAKHDPSDAVRREAAEQLQANGFGYLLAPAGEPVP